MGQIDPPAKFASDDQLGLLPERADEWTAAVWDSWCDMPREGQNLKLRDMLLYGEACYAKAVAAERERRVEVVADEIARLRAALLNCARKAEALKQDCGMDPESKQAVRNAQYQNISTTAHIALGTIRGA